MLITGSRCASKILQLLSLQSGESGVVPKRKRLAGLAHSATVIEQTLRVECAAL